MEDLWYFNPEYEGLFAELAARMQRGEPPLAEELMSILKWKLGRVTREHGRLVAKEWRAIGDALTEASRAEEAREAIHRLLEFKHIGLAVASAMLTACYPDRYTVLDWRVLRELKQAKLHRAPWPTDSAEWDVDGYLDRYVPAVRRFQEQNGLPTLRVADRVLWGRSVRRDIEARLRE